MENAPLQSNRSKDIVKRHHPDRIRKHERNGKTYFQFYCENDIVLRLHVLSDTIIRFRYAFDGDFERDFSYAIDKRFKPKSVNVLFDEFDEKYVLSTDKLHCEIIKEGLLVHIYDSFGNAICEDDTGFYMRESVMKGVSRLKMTKKAPETKRFFGLGDKPGALEMHGKAYENWNTDSFGYDADADTLYRSIPFYYALNEGKAYGIFLDNTYRTRFSFNRQENGVSSFEAHGGEMNYYFMYGPELLQVSEQYMELTGKGELPAMWTLGYHQCRWSYYPEQVVRDLAENFRKHQIPCDAIYFDIDYMDGYRCFTWDKNHFPNPKELIADLKKDGFKSVVMIDPGIKVDKEYHVYKDGIENNVFCRREDGKLMKGPVWPEECVFPDYTNKNVRKWWGELYKDLVLEDGVDGFWNDMNEPAVFEVESKTFPESVRHDFDGNHCSHKKAHNVYGMQMTRATFDGLLKLQPTKRPFVLTRASYAGGQRYAAAWTGDNTASWEHLHIANTQCQRMSISGFSFIGSDVGGFAQYPKADLLTRWFQLAIFHPLYRAHSIGYNLDGGNTINEKEVQKMKESGIVPDQEPWAYGEPFTSIIREAIELRYRLLPYLYTAFYHNARTGEPVLKPLVFFDQTDENTYDREEEFIFGRQILASPVSQEGIETKETYLPKGTWYDYTTGETIEGGQIITIETPINAIPMFVKAGTVLPLYPVMQHTNEKPIDELTLNIYYKNGREVSELYEDRGEGMEYQMGIYSLKTFEFQANDKGMILEQHQKGTFKLAYKKAILHFFGFPIDVTMIQVDGETVEKSENGFVVKAGFGKVVVRF
jgi:alpha-glucosidase